MRISTWAFWFFVCAEYFPRTPFSLHSVSELIKSVKRDLKSVTFSELNTHFSNETFEKANLGTTVSALTKSETQDYKKLKNSIKEKMANLKKRGITKPQPSKAKLEKKIKQNYDSADDEWILQMRSKITNFAQENIGVDWSTSIDIAKKTNLDDLIGLLELEEMELSEKTSKAFNELEIKATKEINETALFYQKNSAVNDLMRDLKVKTSDEEVYLSLLEKKQNETTLTLETPEVGEKERVASTRTINMVKEDDCQICNEGTWTDENHIVFCSVIVLDKIFNHNNNCCRDVILLCIKTAMESAKSLKTTGFAICATSSALTGSIYDVHCALNGAEHLNRRRYRPL